MAKVEATGFRRVAADPAAAIRQLTAVDPGALRVSVARTASWATLTTKSKALSWLSVRLPAIRIMKECDVGDCTNENYPQDIIPGINGETFCSGLATGPHRRAEYPKGYHLPVRIARHHPTQDVAMTGATVEPSCHQSPTLRSGDPPKALPQRRCPHSLSMPWIRGRPRTIRWCRISSPGGVIAGQPPWSCRPFLQLSEDLAGADRAFPARPWDGPK